jgi:protein TonB
MRKIFLLLVMMIGANVLFAQTDTSKGYKIDFNEVTFTSVQVPPQFPGGIPAWTKYLRDSLHSDFGGMYVPLKKGQKTAFTEIEVGFVVDREGHVIEVHIENFTNGHPVLFEEAMRVIRESPKWEPAQQNGTKVRYKQKQKIIFAVQVDG